MQSKLQDGSQNISRSKSKVKFDFCTVRTRVLPILKGIEVKMYPAKIGRSRGWKKQHVAYYVKKLEKAGLIRRLKRSNFVDYELTEQGQNFRISCEGVLFSSGVFRLHRCFFKFPVLREGVYPAADFRRIEMVNWTALLGLEQGVKVRHTTTSWIVHVETLYGRRPWELVTLAKNLADRVAKSLMSKYGCVLGDGQINKRHELGVDDPVANLLNRYFTVSTPKRFIDDSPGEDEGELDHVGRDAAIEYLLMPERVKKLEGQVDNVLTDLAKISGSLEKLEQMGCSLAKVADALGKLVDFESVKEYLAKTKEWNEATKQMTVIVYGSFLKFNNLTWQPPKYKPVDKAPYIPTEAEIDQLISGSGRVLATFLQFLKEPGTRSGEAARLKWRDVDFERKIATITPEKGSRARILPISHKLIDMLNTQPKKTDKIFATAYSLKSNFYETRKSLAFKLQNPRLKEIGLHTFRHWKATMEYHKTREILYVQQLLGHRDLRNTLIYINLEKAIFQNADEEYHVKVAENLQEACKLLEVGFEYVTDLNGAKLFRKRK